MTEEYENREFMIFSVNELDKIDFTQVLETSADTVRRSVDGTKTFIKYEINEVLEDQTYTGINPETQEETSYTTLAGVYGRPDIYQQGDIEYNHEEILEILSTEEWSKPMEEIK